MRVRDIIGNIWLFVFCLGALLLVVGNFADITTNTLLVVSLVMMFAGLLGHIYFVKHKSDY